MEQLRRVISEFGRRIIEHPEQLKAAFAELGGAPGVDGKRFEAILVASRTGIAARIRDSTSASPERVDEWVHTLTHAGCARADAVVAIADWADALGATEITTIARALAAEPVSQEVSVAPGAEPEPEPEAVSVSASVPAPAPAPSVDRPHRNVWRDWRPALLSAAALLVAFAILIPILIATSARPAAAEVKDEPSGLFPAGDLAQFILSPDLIQQIMPALTPAEATPFGEEASPITTPTSCAPSWELVGRKTEDSSAPYGRTATDGQYFLISMGRRYATESDAEKALDALRVGPECATFEFWNGQANVLSSYALLDEGAITFDASDPLVVHYFVDSQSFPNGYTLTRLCAVKANVVSCVRLQGPSASSRDALIAAQDQLLEVFVLAQPFEIPAPTGGVK